MISTAKLVKKMQTPKKNMKKVQILTAFNYVPGPGEAVSTVSDVIPGQAYSIGELLERATRGQRLNVPQRPLNFTSDPEGKGDESFNDTPPDIQDRVEFDQFKASHEERKRLFKERIAQLKKEKDDADARAKQSKEKEDADK